MCAVFDAITILDKYYFFVLQAHLDVCRFDAIPCPNQCTEVLSRLSLDDHLEFSCSKRIVICEFCNQEFPGDAFDLVH